MDSWSHVLLMIQFTIFLSFWHSHTPAYAEIATSPSTLVKQVCNNTNKYYTFCVQALESDNRTKTAPDLLALTKITLDIAIGNATVACGYIHHKINSNGTRPNTKTTLEKCLHWYEEVIASFRSALGEVKENEFMTANYDCLIAGDSARFCEDELASDGVRDLSITARNNVIEKFSGIGFTFTDLLDRGSPPPY